MPVWYKIMCGCEYWIYVKSIHSSFLSWRYGLLKISKDQIHNSQNRRSGEITSCIFETCNNYVIPHGVHVYQKEYYMDIATMCDYPLTHHALPHWRCVLRCCVNFPYISTPSQESDNHHSSTHPTIRFHVYKMIPCWTVYDRYERY